MGDRLRAGKLSQYVTSHPGQLNLAIPLWVGAMNTSLGWEGNRRSGVALVICVTDNSGLSTYGLNGLRKGYEPTLLRSMALLYLYLYLYEAALPTAPGADPGFAKMV